MKKSEWYKFRFRFKGEKRYRVIYVYIDSIKAHKKYFKTHVLYDEVDKRTMSYTLD